MVICLQNVLNGFKYLLTYFDYLSMALSYIDATRKTMLITSYLYYISRGYTVCTLQSLITDSLEQLKMDFNWLCTSLCISLFYINTIKGKLEPRTTTQRKLICCPRSTTELAENVTTNYHSDIFKRLVDRNVFEVQVYINTFTFFRFLLTFSSVYTVLL